MPKVVCIHGIAQEYELEESLLADWAPRLAGAVRLAGGTLDQRDIRLAAYGVLFRPPGQRGKGGAVPEYAAGDVEAGIETEILEEWTDALASDAAPAGISKGDFGERSAATMLQLVGRTPFFGRVAQHVVIWYLKQVRLYLTVADVRQRVQQSVLDLVDGETSVFVAHSLGSVVAYEVLCAHPELPVRTLVTLGSPLGLRAMHPRLRPAIVAGRGRFPAGLERWWNIADAADKVALVKRLAPIFGTVNDELVYNGATMHDANPYLTAVETGRAVAAGL